MKNKLKQVERTLERYIDEVLNDSRYKNPKAEQYVIALCMARNYLLEKINHKVEVEVDNEG